MLISVNCVEEVVGFESDTAIHYHYSIYRGESANVSAGDAYTPMRRGIPVRNLYRRMPYRLILAPTSQDGHKDKDDVIDNPRIVHQ